MFAPRLHEDLVPVNEFRAGLAEWIGHVQESGRPLVLTQRGVAAAVVTSPKMMDLLEEEREVVRVVLRGLQDLQAGRVVSDREVWASVADVLREVEAGTSGTAAKPARKKAKARPAAKKKRGARAVETG